MFLFNLFIHKLDIWSDNVSQYMTLAFFVFNF